MSMLLFVSPQGCQLSESHFPSSQLQDRDWSPDCAQQLQQNFMGFTTKKEFRATWDRQQPENHLRGCVFLTLASLLAKSVLTSPSANIHHSLLVFTVSTLMCMAKVDDTALS